MAYRLAHPFSGAVYTGLEDGRVEVSKDGVTGVFSMYGGWLTGELQTADAELCRWVGTHGYTPASRHLAGFTDHPQDPAHPDRDAPPSHAVEATP